MVKFTAGSSGKEMLLNTYEIGIGSGNPYSTIWKYSSLKMRFGIEIECFEKEPILIPITFRFRGSKKTIAANLNEFFSECEKDIIEKKPGIFTVNEWNLSGFFVERESVPSDKFYGNELSTTFLAPYPFWIQEESFSIAPSTIDNDIANAKGYPMRYPYSFARTRKANRIHIDHYTESNFKLVIFGPTDRVQITIAGHPYIVEYPIAEGEYMVIDSRPVAPIGKQIYIVRTNGKEENIFHYRSCEHSVFKKIPAGDILIDYPGTYGFDLTVFKERSEPKF